MISCRLAILILILFSFASNAVAETSRVAAYVHMKHCWAEGDGESERETAILATLDRMQSLGLNVIVPYVANTSGQSLFPSEVNHHHVYGDWDPVEIFVREARRRGIAVHLCVPVIVCGHHEPAGILTEHPEWALRKEEGGPLGAISPGNKEARQWILRYLEEIVERYQPDGLLLDYMRFPSQASKFESQSAERFAVWQQKNQDLDAQQQLQKFREQLLTELMGKISTRLRTLRPDLHLAIYSWGHHVTANHRVAQPWPLWAKKGYIDEVNVCGYWYPESFPAAWGSTHLEAFKTMLSESRQHLQDANRDVDLTFALGVKTSHGQLNSVSEIKDYLNIAQDFAVDGTTFFTWSYLEPFLDQLEESGVLESYVTGRFGSDAEQETCDEAEPSQNSAAKTIRVTVDRGKDHGQSFGSLFEVKTKDGSMVLGAGFQNLYNTRYRADRHAIQFFLRPTDGQRSFVTETLPRPSDLCGSYLYGRDGVIYSAYGEVSSWNEKADSWKSTASVGGTDETMRVGDGMLRLGDSRVIYNDTEILGQPDEGRYELFFYANGYLFWYHVQRGDGGYRPYSSDDDGFSKLVACPWTPGAGPVDLAKAIVLTLPVVGETTFAWGQLGDQVVTGSNIGGFYRFENGNWRMLLEPRISESYQLYSTLQVHDRLLMGHYPSGRLLEYDGESIKELPNSPPVMEGVSTSAREAQTTVVYGGDVLVGVWPWGELWRFNPDQGNWSLMGRMFEHPAPSDKTVHPYEAESRQHPVKNLWGQRVTSLVPNGPDLFVATSAKSPMTWDPNRFPFLSPDKWKSYGSVYRLTMPGHFSAPTTWTAGATTFEFEIRGSNVVVRQDGKVLVAGEVAGPLGKRLKNSLKLEEISWGDGIYGDFRGRSLEGKLEE